MKMRELKIRQTLLDSIFDEKLLTAEKLQLEERVRFINILLRLRADAESKAELSQSKRKKPSMSVVDPRQLPLPMGDHV